MAAAFAVPGRAAGRFVLTPFSSAGASKEVYSRIDLIRAMGQPTPANGDYYLFSFQWILHDRWRERSCDFSVAGNAHNAMVREATADFSLLQTVV